MTFGLSWRVNASFTSAPDVNDYGVVAGASFTINWVEEFSKHAR